MWMQPENPVIAWLKPFQRILAAGLPNYLFSFENIVIIDWNNSDKLCKSIKRNAIGIIDFKINLAGNPPGSGEVSAMLNELSTKFFEAKIKSKQNGIRNIIVPNKLTQALPLAENLE